MLLFHLHHNYCGKDWEQSKARDMRPSTTNEPHMHTCAHARIFTHKHISHHSGVAINIFCLNLWVYSQIPFPPQEPAVFGIDFIYLMTAVLMTLLTPLMVSQTPQHLRNEDWMGAWRVRGGWYWRGQNEIGGVHQKDEKLETPCTQAVFVFFKQTRTLDAGQKLITTPWTNFYTVAQMKETYPPLIRDWWLVSMTLVDICFLKLWCDSFGESKWNILQLPLSWGQKRTSHF